MATKSITIDVKAYDRLKSHKLPNESFSEAIKRLLPAPVDVDELIKNLRRHPLSRTSMAAIEEQVSHRRVRANRRR
jgi:predicted CopG family antitoxin